MESAPPHQTLDPPLEIAAATAAPAESAVDGSADAPSSSSSSAQPSFDLAYRAALSGEISAAGGDGEPGSEGRSQRQIQQAELAVDGSCDAPSSSSSSAQHSLELAYRAALSGEISAAGGVGDGEPGSEERFQRQIQQAELAVDGSCDAPSSSSSSAQHSLEIAYITAALSGDISVVGGGGVPGSERRSSQRRIQQAAGPRVVSGGSDGNLRAGEIQGSGVASGSEGGTRLRRCLGEITWGAAETIGRRSEMEDDLSIAPEFMPAVSCRESGGCFSIEDDDTTAAAPRPHVRFFGVYDGHGGAQVARYCARRIHHAVAEEWERVGSGDVDCGSWQRRWEDAFCDGFLKVDDELIDEAIAPDIVGSCATVVMVSGCQIISSNCGDSRAILCRRNQIIQMTLDHKPDREDEQARIESQGGRVINWGCPRIYGVLAMSRSIGDRYMRPWVIPTPEVFFVPRGEDDECVVVATDGLWDVMTSNEVGELARRLIRRRRREAAEAAAAPPAAAGAAVPHTPARAVAEQLVRAACQRHSSDNISVIVVDLKPGGGRAAINRDGQHQQQQQ